MGKVHLFPTKTVIYTDTKIAGQTPGNGDAATPFQIEMATVLQFIEDNIELKQTAMVTTGAPSVAVAAGRLVEKIVVIGSGSGTFKLGTTSGGTEILDGESYSTTPAVFAFDQYFASAGALHFSGFSGTLTVKIYSR